MNPELEHQQLLTRRHFFQQTGVGIGGAALSTLLSEGSSASSGIKTGGSLGGPHFAPRAKRVIYLCQSGGPAQMDLFDDKPKMRDWYDVDLPDSVRKGQRLTTMTSNQDRFPVAPSIYSFDHHGQCGTRISELLPYTDGVVDRLCVVEVEGHLVEDLASSRLQLQLLRQKEVYRVRITFHQGNARLVKNTI